MQVSLGLRSILRIGALLAAAALAAAHCPLGQHSLRSGSSRYGNDKIPMANKAFEKFIKDEMGRWNVPGAAVAILDGDKTWARGYGYATLNSTLVTPSTLFYCGSMTKSLTAAAISLLIDQSQKYKDINWSTPISKLMDQFVLSDEWATDHVTVADALSHRTGYPRHDYVGGFFNSSSKMVRSLRHLPKLNEPRMWFGYSNLMYATMGYLVELLTNSTLADFFRDKLWRPMGMFDTFLHPDDALASNKSLATSYYWNNDTKSHGVVPWRDETNIAGAGMAISSVLDWSRYLRHMMKETGPISKRGHKLLKHPHMVVTSSDDLFTGPLYYGFGWQGSVFQDKPAWFHNGRVNSMISFMLMIPSEEFAFVVMMNSEELAAMYAIWARILYDRFGIDKAKRQDTEASWRRVQDWSRQRLEQCSARLYPSLPSPPVPLSVPLKDLAGSYYHPGYGSISASLRCDDWKHPDDSPASPSNDENGCRIVFTKSNVFGQVNSYQLEHKSGESWLGWVFNDDYVTLRRPEDCRKVQIRISDDGRPSSIGIDLHVYEEDSSLIWFDRAN